MFRNGWLYTRIALVAPRKGGPINGADPRLMVLRIRDPHEHERSILGCTFGELFPDRRRSSWWTTVHTITLKKQRINNVAIHSERKRVLRTMVAMLERSCTTVNLLLFRTQVDRSQIAKIISRLRWSRPHTTGANLNLNVLPRVAEYPRCRRISWWVLDFKRLQFILCTHQASLSLGINVCAVATVEHLTPFQHVTKPSVPQSVSSSGRTAGLVSPTKA